MLISSVLAKLNFALLADSLVLWNYDIWNVFVQVGILFSGVLIANVLCKKVGFLKRSLLPCSILGGLIILVLKFIPAFNSIIDNRFMEATAYHSLALGFIATTLKNSSKQKESSFVYVRTGATVVGTYLIQAVFGLAITIIFSYILGADKMLPASGIILALGYGQGTGQAMTWGTVYESDYGFVGGTSFGLTIATVGFIVACIGGVIYLNVLRRRGIITKGGNKNQSSAAEEVGGKNDIPLTESIDRLTIQVALILVTYFIAWLIMQGITVLIDGGALGNFGVKTLKPLIWGFNFLFSIFIAMLVKAVMKLLKKTKLMEKDYTNNFLLDRVGGFVFDLMIIAGAAAIDFEKIQGLLIPILTICIVGLLITFVYVNFVCKRIYPSYRYPAFMSLYGMLTGTASTGIILLREVDPNFETPAATNLVMQNIPAIIMGAPMLLMLGYAPQGYTQTYITLGACALLFVVMNFIIFYKKGIKSVK